MILAVMHAIKEIAIEPEKKNSRLWTGFDLI